MSSALSNIILIAISVWFIALIVAIITLIKRRNITKIEKVFWAAIIFFAPVVGLLFYLLVSFRKKTNNDLKHY